MNRYFFPVFVFLSMLLAACVLPASPSEPTALPSPEIRPESTLPALTEDESFATQALAATLSQPTATLTPTLPSKPAELRSDPSTASLPEEIPVFRFAVQAGTPVMTTNFVDLVAGCDWMGLGGQVFGRDERPVSGLIVEVGGTLNGEPVLSLAMTGGSTRLGPGGYEIALADQPIASQGTLWLQLYDLNGAPQSDQISFDTVDGPDSCEKNLIIINFSEIGSSTRDYYFPNIFKDAR